MDPVLVDPVCRLPVAGHRREVDEVLALSADLLPEGGVVIRSQAATNSDKMLNDPSSLKTMNLYSLNSSGLLRGLWIHHGMNQALKSFIL